LYRVSMNHEIETEKLKEKAMSDELRESYMTLDRESNYKLGVGVRTDETKSPLFFIEVVVSFGDVGDELDIEKQKRRLALLERLKGSDYHLTSEKDNSVVCEKNIEEEKVEHEYKELKKILEQLLYG